MLYSQIVLQGGMPFDLRLPSKKPTAIGALTTEQIDAELAKGVESIKTDGVYTADEVDEILHKRYDI